MANCLLQLLVPLLIAASSAGWAKETSTLFTAERVANARRNVARYPWAAALRDAALTAAEPWAQLSDEALWELVPEQSLPRSAVIRAEGTCPKCGPRADAHGPYSWGVEVLHNPWKVTCPNCGATFPQNDFGAYYRSGKGLGFLWDPKRSDRSLLEPAAAGPGQADQPAIVDDGFGYVDPQGRRYAFVAYYCHWGLWRGLQRAVTDLSRAYLLTGEKLFAHKAAVLLCRLADLYPSYDHRAMWELGFDNASGGTGEGKVFGRLWEPELASAWVLAVDRIWPAVDELEGLTGFLTEQAVKHGLEGDYGSAAAVKAHLLSGLVDATIGGVLSGQIRGLDGTHQATLARAAVVLADPEQTPRLLNWLFQPEFAVSTETETLIPGGRLPGLLRNHLDRDGVPTEAAPDFAFALLPALRQCADLLAQTSPPQDLDQGGALHRLFLAPVRLAALDRWTPNIGDTGKTGFNTRVGWELAELLWAAARFNDPELARAVWVLNGNSTTGLHTSLFDADPEAIQQQIAKAAPSETPTYTSHNLAGYGLALLQSGAGDAGRALWLYYGRNSGRGHRDRLNLGLFAHGLNLLPDLGAPEFSGAWPKRLGWTSHTVSHNTVMVDRHPQATDWGGRPTLFKALTGLSVLEVESPGVYPQCRRYQRQCALIDLDPRHSYAVDCFRVSGGKSHVYSFHAGEGEPVVSGLRLTKQETGTLAGPEVEFGDWGGVTPDWSYSGPGFHYLYNVRAGDATPRFSVDWPVVDTWKQRQTEGQVHLRLTMLGQTGRVTLAHGDPPQNKPGNPRRLRYLLLEREGEDLRSSFVSVLEPYVDEPFLGKVELLVHEESTVALSIALPNGRRDYVYSSTLPDRVVTLTPTISVAGRFAHIRLDRSRVETMTLMGGTLLRAGDCTVACSQPQWLGTLNDFGVDAQGNSFLVTDVPLPPGEVLKGQELYLANDGVRNAAYAVQNVRREGGKTIIALGPVPLTRGFVDEGDYASRLAPNFERGCAFTLPNHVRLTRSTNGTYLAEFTAPVDLDLPSEG